MTLCAALMLCFAACDKDEEGNTNNSNTPNNDTPSGQVDPALLPGTWLVDTMTINGANHTPENFMLIFYSDGSGLLNDNGETENNEFSWSISGNKITVTQRHGATEYTITKLTAQEASFFGSQVQFPGGDGETANVNMHMIKIDEPGPGPGPGPGPNPNNFPAGTQWRYHVYVNGIESTLMLTFNQTGDTGNLDYTLTIPGSEPEHEVINFTYTYDSDARTGLVTGTNELGELESYPFNYDPDEDVINLTFRSENPGEEPPVLTFMRWN